jgi:hypothetical protein
MVVLASRVLILVHFNMEIRPIYLCKRHLETLHFLRQE